MSVAHKRKSDAISTTTEQELEKVLATEKAAAANKQTTRSLTCARYWRCGTVPSLAGYFTLLPNKNAGYNLDANVFDTNVLRANTLSPMRSGPVKHRQPGLPNAKNFENFWQSGKVYWHECSNWSAGKPLAELVITPAFFTKQLEWYADETPHRHKFGLKRKNEVAFQLFVAKDGCQLRLSYIQSRVIYCSFYEDLVRGTAAFQIIKDMHARDGRNLLIAGPDARNEQPANVDRDKIEAWYNDTAKPCGHECVLLAMLVYETGEGAERLPWRRAWRAQFDESFADYMK